MKEKQPRIKRKNQGASASGSGTKVAEIIQGRDTPDHVHDIRDNDPDAVAALKCKTVADFRSMTVQRAEAKAAHKVRMAELKEEKIRAARLAAANAMAEEQLARSAANEKKVAEYKQRLQEKYEKAQEETRVRVPLTTEEKDLITFKHHFGEVAHVHITAKNIAKDIERCPSTVKSFLRRAALRAASDKPNEPVLRGGRNIKCRRESRFTAEQVDFACRWMAVNGEHSWKTCLTKVIEKFGLQEESKKWGKHVHKTLAKKLKTMVGFRVADFVQVPVNRNLDRVKNDRQRYVSQMMKNPVAYQHAIFIDESPFNSCTQPGKGKSVSGTSPVFLTERMDLPNLTVIAAISMKEIVYDEVLVGSVTGAVYADFLRKLLAAVERGNLWPPSGKLFIISDNCSIHKEKANVRRVEEEFKDKVEFVFLPPYSPFLDPVEEVFAIWKLFYCRHLLSARAKTLYGVSSLIARARQEIRQHHVIACWSHASQFWEQCLAKGSILGHEILDKCHEGDELAAARAKIFEEMQLPHVRDSLRYQRIEHDHDNEGPVSTPPVTPENTELQALSEAIVVCGEVQKDALDRLDLSPVKPLDLEDSSSSSDEEESENDA
jgi:transposase